MSYRLKYNVVISFNSDAVGQVMEGTSTNSMSFSQFPPFDPVVPGGNTLTSANLQTALTAMATDIFTQVTSLTPQMVQNQGFPTNLARLQAFSTGAAQ